AVVTLITYLGQTVWPANLAVFYPHPENNIRAWQVALGVALFASISGAALLFRKKTPYFFTGWFWFVGMLVPVIGIVQVGIQAHADRYMYLPQIGLSLIFVWAIVDLSATWRHRQLLLSILSVAVLASLAWCGWLQTSFWRDSESLWTRALAVTPDNETVREHLADAYLDKGRIDDAIAQARLAVAAQPESADAHGVLGAALGRTRHLDEALAHLHTALELNPQLARAHFNLGNVLLQLGEIDQALENYEMELRLQPNFPEGHNNLANALFRKGNLDAAFLHLETALRLNPNYPEAHNNLGIALSQKGQMREAIAEWNKTLATQPDNLEAQCNLAWVYATFPDSSVRNGPKALELAERALQLSGGKNAKIWRLFAAAHAEVGQFNEAIKAAESARALAEADGNAKLAQT